MHTLSKHPVNNYKLEKTRQLLHPTFFKVMLMITTFGLDKIYSINHRGIIHLKTLVWPLFFNEKFKTISILFQRPYLVKINTQQCPVQSRYSLNTC